MATRTEYQHGEFSWVNLGTTDPASAKRFYGGLFGWQFNDIPAGPGMTYTFCELKRQSIGGLYALPEELQSRGVPSHWIRRDVRVRGVVALVMDDRADVLVHGWLLRYVRMRSRATLRTSGWQGWRRAM